MRPFFWVGLARQLAAAVAAARENGGSDGAARENRSRDLFSSVSPVL